MKKVDEKFISIPIRDLSKKIICDGHVYILSKEGRRFYVQKPGIFLDEEFIKKHATSNTQFEYVPVSDDKISEKFTALFKDLRYLQFENDLKRKTREILKVFQEIYSTEEHFLSFVIACHNEFSSVPNELLTRMHQTDIYLFRKGIYSAAFSIIIALSNGYFHYPMLKDFYNISLTLDAGLCDSGYSYFVAEACNRENQSPGSGKNWMASEMASPVEIKTFLQHPLNSYNLLKQMEGLLAYPELAEIALYQHELSNGGGFPRGIHKGQVSSWEAIILLADALVEIRDEFNFETNVVGYLVNFENKKLSELPIEKSYKRLCLALEPQLKEGVG